MTQGREADGYYLCLHLADASQHFLYREHTFVAFFCPLLKSLGVFDNNNWPIYCWISSYGIHANMNRNLYNV